MARGLPKKYIKAFGVTKKAWREYRAGSLDKKKKPKKTTKAKKTKRRTRSMARKKKSSRRRRFTIPLSIAAPFAWKLFWPVRKAMSGDWFGARNDLLWHFAAVDSSGNFNAEALKTWVPVIVGALIHKFVGGYPLNLNRYLKDVPLVRI